MCEYRILIGASNTNLVTLTYVSVEESFETLLSKRLLGFQTSNIRRSLSAFTLNCYDRWDI